MATLGASNSPRRIGVVLRAYLVAVAIGAAAGASIAGPARAAGNCVGGIRTGCRRADQSTLLIKNPSTDHDKLIWKWLKGDATMLAELGDPTTTTQYALCVYAGTSAAAIIEADVVPSGTLWTASGTTGFKYKDGAGSSDGIRNVLLKAGAIGKAKVLLKGKGANLPDPSAGPFTLPVTAQLVNSTTSACFEGVYTAADIIKNEAEQFKAKVHCGDNTAGGGEQCDGTDDAACPGECLPNCTCPVPCGSSAPACSGACPPGQSCGNSVSGCACGPANPTACGSSFPTCNGACPVGETCASNPLGGNCGCVPITSTPCANSLGSVPICGGACPLGTSCHHVPALYCACF